MRCKLSLVIPVGKDDEAHLETLLASIDRQDYPKDALEVLIIREGNSEEAKALGIRQAAGEIIGMCCTDNVLLGDDFLTRMVDAARQPGVVGAYPERYAYVKDDTALSRYFALLGANDPLCWWLGKADRQSYLTPTITRSCTRTFSRVEMLPSLGDNGFFLKAFLAKSILTTPERFGSCMDMCEDLRRAGYATYTVVPTTLWHRSGLSWRRYFLKRWRYVRELYWRRLSSRRWHMVSTRGDWWGVCTFVLASLTGLPHLWVSVQGYRRVPDRSWFIHPLVCFLLTWVYAVAWLEHLMRRLLFRPGTVRRATPPSGGA